MAQSSSRSGQMQCAGWVCRPPTVVFHAACDLYKTDVFSLSDKAKTRFYLANRLQELSSDFSGKFCEPQSLGNRKIRNFVTLMQRHSPSINVDQARGRNVD